MIIGWVPKQEKDLRKLTNAIQRQIKALIKKEKSQYNKIVKMLEYYQLNGASALLPEKIAYITDDNGIIRFKEFEYVGKADNNKNIFNVIIAYVNKQRNKLDSLKIFTEENFAGLNDIDGAYMGRIESRVSPFGGSSKIKLYDKVEYHHSYADNGETYRIGGAQIIDANNYSISYSKKSGNKSFGCGNVICYNGKIVYAYFDEKDDFEAICQLYKTKNISRVQDECVEHVKKSRSLI